MLKRTRVSGKMDMNRLASALRTPGIDPRCWVCLAAVQAFTLDPEEGAFADVEILSTGQTQTVRVGAFYAGPGFGFYAPLAVDDEVLVAFPDGDPDHGGVVIARMWSRSDQPAQLAKDHTADVAIQVQTDKNLRIQVFGGGNVVLGAENGKVLLGDETGTKPVARKDDRLTASTAMAAWAGVVEGFANGIVPGTFTPANQFSGPLPANPGGNNNFGSITEGSDKVESS